MARRGRINRGKMLAERELYPDTTWQDNPQAARQGVIARIYFDRLKEMCLNRFTWSNLPNKLSTDSRYLEYLLFHYGFAVWYWDHDLLNHFTVRGTYLRPNALQNPTKFLITTVNPTNGMFMNKELRYSEAVPIWSNLSRRSDSEVAMMYAQRLAELDRTLEINTLQMRSPFIVKATQQGLLSLQNAMKDVQDGNFAIYVNDGLDLNGGIDVLNTQLDNDGVLKLTEVREKTWNQAMTMLGINNANQDKRERLVADEVDANSDQVSTMLAGSLRARQYAAEEINRRWGLSVDVSTAPPIQAPHYGNTMSVEYHGEESESDIEAGRS